MKYVGKGEEIYQGSELRSKVKLLKIWTQQQYLWFCEKQDRFKS